MSLCGASRIAGSCLLVAITVSACGAGDGGSVSSTGVNPANVGDTTSSATAPPERGDRTPATLPETVPPSSYAPVTVTGEVPEDLLAPVIADAAVRAGVDASDIEVVTAQEMVWPDGSLGCAEAGQSYTQAPVPGYWVVLEIVGVGFDYRLGGGGFFKLCTSPFTGAGGTSPSS